MSLPSLDKAYGFDVNHLYTSTGVMLSDARQIMRGIKNSLKGFGSGAWTCLGSSNGTTAGLDASDRWAADSDLNWAGSGAHSWIVLDSSGIAGLSICIDLFSSSSFNATIVVSPTAGFTGGTTSARPTATDEIILLSASTFISSSPNTARVHVIQSTDGQVTHVIICSLNTINSYWHFSTPKNPIAAWTSPNIAFVGNSNPMNTTTLFSSASIRGKIGSVACSFYCTGEAYNGSLIATNQSFADEDTGEWPMTPIGLFCSTSLHRGRKGTIYDLYWGSTTATIADSYPASGTLYQFAQFGHLIVPWNQTAPLAA